MPRFTKQELKVMKDGSLSLQEKSTILNRSMSSIRSKHWAMINKPVKREARVIKTTTDDIIRYRESNISKKFNSDSSLTPINISIDSIKRNIIISY